VTWPTLTLGQLTATTRPICYGVLKPGPYVEGGVPLLRIVDMAGHVVAQSGYHRISSTLDSEFHRSRLRGGEVLLSIQGTVGRVATVPAALAGANISRPSPSSIPTVASNRGFCGCT
jgi:type I restriction enzyme S subunit